VATLVLAPTPVQGLTAAPDVAEALRRVSRAGVDVVILARGGGSLEDLAAFNQEGVVRAIRAAACPVITGVGHETDTTLADLAADRRAATPTAAAELCTPDIDAFRQRIDATSRVLEQSTRRRVTAGAERLEQLRRGLNAASPWAATARRAEALRGTRERMGRAIDAFVSGRAVAVDALSARLHSLGPEATFTRGYAHVSRAEDGVTVCDPAQAPDGTELNLRVALGYLGARSLGSRARTG
jgi:exodeoxyribonuclease VII large subunit